MSEPHNATEPWRTCYQQLAPKLLLYARQWVPSDFDAEDAVQTAFIRFWRKRPEASPVDYPLLYSAVRSTAIDMLRTAERRGRRETFSQTASETSLFFDPSPEQREDAEMLETALRKLPPEQRESVVLKVWGELTFAEVAQVVGESINTVASRYRYGIEALRKLLKPQIHERV